jgi:hypothetical protein
MNAERSGSLDFPASSTIATWNARVLRMPLNSSEKMRFFGTPERIRTSDLLLRRQMTSSRN